MGRGQITEDKCEKSEDGCQRTEDGIRNAECGKEKDWNSQVGMIQLRNAVVEFWMAD